jgi:hypothetical protein
MYLYGMPGVTDDEAKAWEAEQERKHRERAKEVAENAKAKATQPVVPPPTK